MSSRMTYIKNPQLVHKQVKITSSKKPLPVIKEDVSTNNISLYVTKEQVAIDISAVDISNNIEPEEKSLYKSEVFSLDESIDNLKELEVFNDIESYKPFSYIIKHSYWNERTHIASSLDIIAVFLKGQKHLYIESKEYCEWYLNFLMIPAICISAMCTVISVVLGNNTEFGALVVSCLTALNSFILAMISYLKLDAKAEAHKVSAYKFDKLQIQCEFYSGKVMYSNDEKITDSVPSFIETVEKNIQEIKEINQFIIPETIRYRYPRLFSTNIFAEIKKRSNIERIYIHELNSVYNNIIELKTKGKDTSGLNYLESYKQELIKQIIRFRNQYLDIDRSLISEINQYIEFKHKSRCCSWYFKKYKFDDDTINTNDTNSIMKKINDNSSLKKVKDSI
jgi:hypothetical protein